MLLRWVSKLPSSPRFHEMKLLVVAALAEESRAILGDAPWERDRIGPFEALVGSTGDLGCDIVVSGIGSVASAAATSTALALRGPYDFVISAGIGGGFDAHGVELTELIVADEIVNVDYVRPPEDQDLGVDPTAWTPIVFPAAESFVSLVHETADARRGAVLTVTTMTDSHERQSSLAMHYPSAVAEAMEGAGVAFAAWKWDVPFGEVRTISNFVGQDFSGWETEAALERLKSSFVDLRRSLSGREALP
jgi:futalosine hydrolase